MSCSWIYSPFKYYSGNGQNKLLFFFFVSNIPQGERDRSLLFLKFSGERCSSGCVSYRGLKCLCSIIPTAPRIPIYSQQWRQPRHSLTQLSTYPRVHSPKTVSSPGRWKAWLPARLTHSHSLQKAWDPSASLFLTCSSHPSPCLCSYPTWTRPPVGADPDSAGPP